MSQQGEMAECRGFPLIKVVRAYTVVPASDGDQGADCHDVDDKHWINGYPTPVANPMSGYALYKDTRKSWGINALGTLVVEVCIVNFQDYGSSSKGASNNSYTHPPRNPNTHDIKYTYALELLEVWELGWYFLGKYRIPSHCWGPFEWL